MPPLEVTANAFLWWAHPDSNREPKDYESPAPPLSYRPVSDKMPKPDYYIVKCAICKKRSEIHQNQTV